MHFLAPRVVTDEQPEVLEAMKEGIDTVFGPANACIDRISALIAASQEPEMPFAGGPVQSSLPS